MARYTGRDFRPRVGQNTGPPYQGIQQPSGGALGGLQHAGEQGDPLSTAAETARFGSAVMPHQSAGDIEDARAFQMHADAIPMNLNSPGLPQWQQYFGAMGAQPSRMSNFRPPRTLSSSDHMQQYNDYVSNAVRGLQNAR